MEAVLKLIKLQRINNMGNQALSLLEKILTNAMKVSMIVSLFMTVGGSQVSYSQSWYQYVQEQDQACSGNYKHSQGIFVQLMSMTVACWIWIDWWCVCDAPCGGGQDCSHSWLYPECFTIPLMFLFVCFVLIRNNLLPWTECSLNNNNKTVYKVIEYKKKTKTTFGYTHN